MMDAHALRFIRQRKRNQITGDQFLYDIRQTAVSRIFLVAALARKI